jgi:hypothetical protein
VRIYQDADPGNDFRMEVLVRIVRMLLCRVGQADYCAVMLFQVPHLSILRRTLRSATPLGLLCPAQPAPRWHAVDYSVSLDECSRLHGGAVEACCRFWPELLRDGHTSRV